MRCLSSAIWDSEVLQLGSDQWKMGPGMVLPHTALAAAALQVPMLDIKHIVTKGH
jgi:hypothetical protein